MNVVEIRNLTKRFRSEKCNAIEEITTSIPKGKMVALVGPDGAGKTTLLRLMAGLLRPTLGSITVGGYDTVKDPECIRFFTGYMPQKFGLYEDLTVEQNLNLYAELRNVRVEDKAGVCEKLLRFTSLSPFKKRLAKNLSGGMKQKLGLACALIKKPMLLLLDEPSVGIDPKSRRELWTMVKELLKEEITVVWSSAYLDEAEKCDHIFLLSQGKLLYDGNPETLTREVSGKVFLVKTRSEEKRKVLQKLLMSDHVIDGTIQGEKLRILLKEGALKGFETEPAAARFEDAFIYMLGGGPKGESKLAEMAPVVPHDASASVEAVELSKVFGSYTAVDRVSLRVSKGEIFGLLGPNGAGKTTIFKMLCGLIFPTTGRALVNNLDLQKAPSVARSHIGYMAQKFSLYDNLTVHQNLSFFSGVYGLTHRKKKEAIESMVSIFGLEKYLKATVGMLPLGFKQRLALACANMHRPDILFLDEPTSGVDPITRREFWNHINGLVEKGVTIFITTHFMDEAEYCDRIALIYRGKIITMDTPDHLKEKMKTEACHNPTLEDVFITMLEQNG